MPLKRLVLLSASPPGESGVGQNYLRDIAGCLPADHIVCCPVLASGEQVVQLPNLDISDYKPIRKYETAWRRGGGVLSEVTALGAYKIYTQRWATMQALMLNANDEFRSASHILVVLESPQLILMADCLSSRVPCPMSVIVWDHPDHLLSRFGHKSVTRRLLKRAFTRVIQRAASTVSVSPALKLWLTSIAPRATHVIVPAPVTAKANVPVTRPNSDSFDIGFAGSVTAPAELEGLQKALDGVRWRINGLPVNLRMSGPRFVLSARSPRRVQYHGFFETTEAAIEELRNCDACFLPQPFARQDELVARYSFPTKLSTYLSAGRPVIIHAPEYGSIPSMFPAMNASGECGVGLLSTSADSKSLLDHINQLIDPKRYEQCARRISDTRNTYFSSQRCAEELRKAIASPQ